MFIRGLEDVRPLLAGLKGSLTGVGMTAYSRIIPAYLHPSYRILALRMTGDLDLLRGKADIFCLEEALGKRVEEEGFNSSRLLATPQIRAFMERLPEPRTLFIYQNYPELEALADRAGWRLLANPSHLRLRWAERSFFVQMARALELRRLPGAIYSFEKFLSSDYDAWASLFGSTFVLQLPDLIQGGGRGTFFIASPEDYKDLADRLRPGRWRGAKLFSVAIHQRIKGYPASMALCLTSQGTLFASLQRQLVDLPYCRNIPENGVFCGHSWGETSWSSTIRKEAKDQARRISDYLAGLGYRGILGIDFMIEETEDRVFPIEINPRLTGAFPMLSQFYLEKKWIPMEVFHILEFLGHSYRIDVEGLNELYSSAIRGGHLLLFDDGERGEVPKAGLRAGVYQYQADCDSAREKITFMGHGPDFQEVDNKRAFLVMEGPAEDSFGPVRSPDPFKRLCRLIFPEPVTDDRGRLTPEASHAVNWVYKKIYNDVKNHS